MRFANISLALVLLTAGCKARDGDILAQMCRKTGEKVGVMAGKAPVHLTGALYGSAGEASVTVRVQNRIRWDRYLSTLDIQVQSTATGTVTLRGKTPDISIKQRVLDLARSTTGVQRVEDRMTLPKEE